MRSVSVGVVFSQRRTQLTTEPAMGCDSGPPLNRNWVGRPSTYIVCVVETRAARFTASIEWVLARTGDAGGINKR